MMFRVRSPSLASVRRGSNHTRTKCFGIISSRTATLCLALIGILAHLQTFRHLEILYDSFPNVPKTRNNELNKNEMMTIMMMTDKGVNRFNSNTIKPSEPADVVLDSEFNFIQPSSNVWTPSTSTIITSNEEALEMVKPTKWFNLIPKRPWGEGKSSPEQDEERKSWEAAKILTIMMKIYSITSIIACLIGVHGVIRSNLFSTRIFILSSLIDVFFFALSVMSICIIITYPEIRSMLCEQISSGELHSLLNYMRGSNSSSMSSLSSSSATAAMNQQNSQESSIVALSQPPASVLPAANFISKSASSFWARTLESSKSLDENSSNRTYWWDTLLDDMLENESCDDIFVSVLVPIGLMICLVYLIFRIHFLFVIRSYYVSLVRQKMGFYLESSSSDTSKTSSKENLSTINEKFNHHV